MLKKICILFSLIIIAISCNKKGVVESDFTGVWYSVYHDKSYIEFSFIPKDTLYVYICDNIGESLQSQMYTYKINDDSLFVFTMDVRGKAFRANLYVSKLYELYEDSFIIENFWVYGEKLKFEKFESVAMLEDYVEANYCPILPLIRRAMVFSRKYNLDYREIRNELENTIVKYNWKIAQPKFEDSTIMLVPDGY